MAIQIQTQLKKIGIDVQIDKLTPATYQEQYFSRKAQAVLVQDCAWVADPGYSLGLFFGSGPNSVANWVNYNNKEVDALLERDVQHGRRDQTQRTGAQGSSNNRRGCPLGFLHRHRFLYDRANGSGGAELARQQLDQLR